MNALAGDQARRLAKVIWNEPRLKGRVTAGLYVGGEGDDDKVMGADHVITDREVLRKHPPDILLTNYKMLDFLMLRPEDGKLWKDTGPESVRYIVLDELHTYDGAQGSDVACLLRRLRAKLNLKPGSYCCVGTSATLAGDEATATGELIEFASKLFGVRFPRDSVITEDRLDMGEYLTDDEEYPDLPTPTPDMVPTRWRHHRELHRAAVQAVVRQVRPRSARRRPGASQAWLLADHPAQPRREDHRLGHAHRPHRPLGHAVRGLQRRGPPPHVAVVPGPGQSRQAAGGRPGRAVPGLPGATVGPGDEPAGAGRGGEAGILLAGRDAASGARSRGCRPSIAGSAVTPAGSASCGSRTTPSPITCG